MDSRLFALVILLVFILLLILVMVVVVGLKLWNQQMTTFQGILRSQELERERLMNRAMSKDWESYVHLTNSMTSNYQSDPAPPVGMSDEEELRRLGISIAESVGLGEEPDFDDDNPNAITDFLRG